MRNSPVSLCRKFEGPGKRGSLSNKKATKSKVTVLSSGENSSNVQLGYIKLGLAHVIPHI